MLSKVSSQSKKRGVGFIKEGESTEEKVKGD